MVWRQLSHLWSRWRCAVLAHWRHDNAVSERDIADLERREECGRVFRGVEERARRVFVLRSEVSCVWDSLIQISFRHAQEMFSIAQGHCSAKRTVSDLADA